jgi:hypothetical protein
LAEALRVVTERSIAAVEAPSGRWTAVGSGSVPSSVAPMLLAGVAADDAEVMQALKDCAASIISAVAHGEDALGTIVGGLVLGSLVGRNDG